jgi:chromate transporter
VVDLRYGILPVIIAVIAHAVYVLGRRALVTPLQVAIGVAAFASFLADVPELLILAVAGLMCALWAARRALLRRGTASLAVAPFALRFAADDPTRPVPVTLWRLFLVFLEIGSVLYGSGYVLVAFLQSHLVDRYGWLTSEQVLDAVTVGQITPGPVFTTATFVGWQVRGPWGAAVATVGIFLPAFVFVALLGRIVPWMRARPVAAAFLGGVTTASLGLMAGVLVQLTGDAVVDVVTALVALVALAVLVATRVNTMWLVGAGALVGVAHALLA